MMRVEHGVLDEQRHALVASNDVMCGFCGPTLVRMSLRATHTYTHTHTHARTNAPPPHTHTHTQTHNNIRMFRAIRNISGEREREIGGGRHCARNTARWPS